MPAALNLIGQRFGILTVVSKADRRTPSGQWMWNCLCDCGGQAVCGTGWLRSGTSGSCGCRQRLKGERNANFKHGLSDKSNPKYKEYSREMHDLHKYGLTKERKQHLISAQGNKCAICGYQFGQKKGDMKVDHCHSTGEVRGLLCDLCNRGLGMFRDNKTALNKAINYLSR